MDIFTDILSKMAKKEDRIIKLGLDDMRKRFERFSLKNFDVYTEREFEENFINVIGE